MLELVFEKFEIWFLGSFYDNGSIYVHWEHCKDMRLDSNLMTHFLRELYRSTCYFQHHQDHVSSQS